MPNTHDAWRKSCDELFEINTLLATEAICIWCWVFFLLLGYKLWRGMEDVSIRTPNGLCWECRVRRTGGDGGGVLQLVFVAACGRCEFAMQVAWWSITPTRILHTFRHASVCVCGVVQHDFLKDRYTPIDAADNVRWSRSSTPCMCVCVCDAHLKHKHTHLVSFVLVYHHKCDILIVMRARSERLRKPNMRAGVSGVGGFVLVICCCCFYWYRYSHEDCVCVCIFVWLASLTNNLACSIVQHKYTCLFWLIQGMALWLH